VQNLAQRREERGFCRRTAAEDRCYAAIYRNITTPNREVAMVPMRRKLVWVERTNFQGWACSECAWVFNASWPLVGHSIEEMKTKFGEERDKEFASHVCADHPRPVKDHH
jgi:rubredoxin